jgi:hypothetical protein
MLVASSIFILASAVIPAPVRAGTIISGTFSGDATLTLTGTPGVYLQNFTGDGDDATYGSFTPNSQSTVDFSHPPKLDFSNGSITEVFANGTLFGTSSGDGTGNGQGSATFTIDFVITGGTGIFKGDAGEATLTGTITQNSATTETISNGSYTGTLTSAPVPPTWTMLIAGLLGLGFFAHRGRKIGSPAIAAV